MLYVLVKLDGVTSLLSNPRQITFRLYSFCHELRLFLLQSELTIYIYVTYITCLESIKPPHSECQQVIPFYYIQSSEIQENIVDI